MTYPAQTYQANDIDSRTVPAGRGERVHDGFIYGPPGTTTPERTERQPGEQPDRSHNAAE